MFMHYNCAVCCALRGGGMWCDVYVYVSELVNLIQVRPLGASHIAHVSLTTPSRLRLIKIPFCLELFRISSGHVKPLLDPRGGLRSEAVVTWPLQKRSVKRLQMHGGHHPVARIGRSPLPNGRTFPFGCSGHVTAVAALANNQKGIDRRAFLSTGPVRCSAIMIPW
jgi:hypothetical protein